MRSDITAHATMLEFQGDRVAVYKGNSGPSFQWILTIVRAVHENSSELRLVNREGKTGKPDWVLTQAILDALQPFTGPAKDDCKWQIRFK